MSKYIFTSESVTEGHPDKMCDQVSDAVLDAIIKEDKTARVACETFMTTGLVLVAGEISTNCYVDIEKTARDTIREIGYDRAKYGFDCDTCAVITSVHAQSPDIAMGVNKALEAKKGEKDQDDHNGAGDQGMMFGYAVNETPSLMPATIYYAHKLTKRLAEVRKSKELDYLRPDGKSQVTIEYENGLPARVSAVVISSQHSAEVDHATIEKDIIERVIKRAIPDNLLDSATKYFINPTGRFVLGGPAGDTGLTGRKIIVDTYGGWAGHGGGALSGKDPTKVDRSGAYMGRYIAKNIVAAGLADRCEVQVSYAIGVAKPISVFVNTYGTGKLPDAEILKLIDEYFDLRPTAIIQRLDLRRPIYKKTAAYGHFGRDDAEFPWEKTDAAENLRKHL